MLQYFAQGACMALEDAISLAEAAARHPDNIASAFVSYELERIQRTARVQLGSRLLGRLYHATAAERAVRSQVLGSMSQVEFRERLAWLYAYDSRGAAGAKAG
jgi:salicylate hydroxylase